MGTVELNSPVKMVFTVIAVTLAFSAIAQSVPVPSPQTAQDWARWTAVNPADWAKVTNVDWSGATGNIDWSRTTNVDWSNALSIPADWGRTINLPGLSNAFTGLVGSSSAYRKKRSASPIPQNPDWGRFTAANPANWAQFTNGINFNSATGTNGIDWSSATGNIDWSRVNNVDDWRRVLSPLVSWGRTVALPALGNALDLIIDSSSSSDNYSY